VAQRNNRARSGRPPLGDLRRASAPTPAQGYGGGPHALWVSKFGTALSDVAIHRQISVLTGTEFGQPITLHRFRTIAATTLANFRLEEVHLASQALGHCDERLRDDYIRASGLIATRRSHQCEDELLQAAQSEDATAGTERGRNHPQRGCRSYASKIKAAQLAKTLQRLETDGRRYQNLSTSGLRINDRLTHAVRPGIPDAAAAPCLMRYSSRLAIFRKNCRRYYIPASS
jgi:hypothetical protein